MRDYNIFISHSWSYSDSYEKLVELLEEASYFSFRDFSMNKMFARRYPNYGKSLWPSLLTPDDEEHK